MYVPSTTVQPPLRVQQSEQMVYTSAYKELKEGMVDGRLQKIVRASEGTTFSRGGIRTKHGLRAQYARNSRAKPETKAKQEIEGAWGSVSLTLKRIKNVNVKQFNRVYTVGANFIFSPLLLSHFILSIFSPYLLFSSFYHLCFIFEEVESLHAPCRRSYTPVIITDQRP